MTLIQVKDLYLGYEKQVVVSGLSFDIHEGDYLCLVGENGSGKTTLMKALLRLIEPLDGSIIFSEDVKRNQIGYLPQQSSHRSFFPATVKEVILSGFAAKDRKRPFYSALQKSLAQRNMERMGIEDFSASSFSKLSGGQQQRVLLARALCASEKILLLDEPVAGLDQASADTMYALIRDLHSSGMTIIMITHDLQDVIDDVTHILEIGKTSLFTDTKTYLKRRKETDGVE